MPHLKTPMQNCNITTLTTFQHIPAHRASQKDEKDKGASIAFVWQRRV